MTSTIKVNNIQNQCGANIINESSNTITIGASGDTIALASGASQTGFGRTGTVDWQTSSIKTATFTAVNGEGYFCNTTSSAFTVNLPAGSAGAIVSLADYAATWQTNNLTVSPNGSEKIGGNNADLVLNTEGQSVTFVYVDSTEGWLNVQDSTSNERANPFIIATGGTITTSGNCKIHTFTGPGTFAICCAAVCAANNLVSYAVVAGGGGGSGMDGNNSQGGGGGGAGGFREVKSPVTPYTASPLDGYSTPGNRITVSAQSYPITVGGGGTAGSMGAGGNTGSNSVFSTITAAGGGGVTGGCSGNGKNGGSGGGGSANSGTGGSGNTPPVTPSQGNNGGNGNGSGPKYGGGAGGGATGTGGNGNNPGACSGVNGTGATTSISATPTLYAEGGGGANYCAPSSPPGHSQGSGGNAGFGPYPGGNACGQAGTVNTGGGGGGGSAGGHPQSSNAGAGGSGVVIIRYKYQ
jgi:hypothetical protein